MSPDALLALVLTLYVLGGFMSLSLAIEDDMIHRWHLAFFTALWPVFAIAIIVGMVRAIYTGEYVHDTDEAER